MDKDDDRQDSDAQPESNRSKSGSRRFRQQNMRRARQRSPNSSLSMLPSMMDLPAVLANHIVHPRTGWSEVVQMLPWTMIDWLRNDDAPCIRAEAV